ncbi:hypothetical protein BDN72DRAFT_964880 [Pluteus cervinus]|uniref:Uncharacterized protein n=1 Tax=Pluteus cervinus TaxID=181527 RepID=A0ACD3A8H2_9AGAR|nr:hypothetical protein BDN72DRAFT_964880 [Pluteus cervinus]
MSSQSQKLPSARGLGLKRRASRKLKVATKVSPLVELPIELLEEIIAYLDWTSVLQLRQVCISLHTVYKDRIIWTSLLNIYNNSLPNPPRLDGPHYAYTPGQLEKHLLRRLSTKKAWGSLSPYTRTAECHMKAHLFHLLPGGRWLLTAQRSGEVTIYDLDSRAVSGTLIIPADPALVEVRHMAVEVDRKSDFLSFRLVLCPDLQQAVSVPIYQVAFSINPAISWNCRELRRLTATNAGAPTSISIKGDVIAISIRKAVKKDLEGDFVQVFNWQKWDPSTITPQVLIPMDVYDGPLLRVNLLSESEIISFTRDTISLHDIPLVDGDGEAGQLPVWSVAAPFDIDGEGISQPSLCGDNTHFTLRVDSSVYGFAISELRATPGTFRELFKFPFLLYEDILCLGHHRAFARTSNLDAVTIEFTCDGDSVGVAQVPRNGTKVTWCPLDTCMDEESGRVVVCMRGQFTIYDFVYPHYVL